MNKLNQIVKIIAFVLIAIFLRFFIIENIVEKTDNTLLLFLIIPLIFIVGIGIVFRGTAKVIEETTDVLKDRTKLAGGFLQAFGTAFPDMVIGVVAALISLKVRDTDYLRAINLAIIAASTTFGSNIYNILHAVWCVRRQAIANAKHSAVLMFPPFKSGGTLKPFKDHKVIPAIKELDNATSVLTALTLLTSFVAISMVIFGQVNTESKGVTGDLYQLIAPLGMVLFVMCIGVLFHFRKNHRPESPIEEVYEEERYYAKQSSGRIWLDLVLSGVAILFTAESMVKTMEVFSHITNIPFVITGIFAGLIGCFGEMIVIHNFSVNPNGRIGDAIVGVAMDNIVTTMGAAIVAIMGGIFLGSNSLILIFIIILAANTLLIGQISRLKNDVTNIK